MKRRMIPGLVGFIVIQAALAFGADFTGKVVGVLDGDTIEVLHDGHPTRVRLSGIDCPEKGQPFGKKAKQFTSTMVFGQEVTVQILGVDKYGRTIGDVMLGDGRNLNRELVRTGFAWWYRKHSTDSSLGDLENEARLAKRGLWVDPDPIPPWQWRKQRKGRAPSKPQEGGNMPKVETNRRRAPAGPAPKISISLPQGILDQIDARGEERSPVIAQDLDRYYRVLAEARTRLRDKLTPDQVGLILDACNGLRLDYEQSRHLFWAEVEDAIRLDKIDEKWKVDGPALVALLRGLDHLETEALADAINRFWVAVGRGDHSRDHTHALD